MSLSESTRNLLTAIAEYLPRVKQQGHDEGRKAEYDAFWDSFQQKGNRTDYIQAFSYRTWTNEIFKPKYQIKPTNANQLFYRNNVLTGEIPEVINIDFSNCTSFSQTFQDFSKITRLGVIDLRKATLIENLFGYCNNLVTIDKIIMSETTPFNTGIAEGSAKLANVVFEGVIGKSISFSKSPLTVESMKSVISHLKNYTGVVDDSGNSLENKYTLTLKASCVTELESATFTDEDIAALEEKGITVTDTTTWITVIDDLKWNLVSA